MQSVEPFGQVSLEPSDFWDDSLQKPQVQGHLGFEHAFSVRDKALQFDMRPDANADTNLLQSHCHVHEELVMAVSWIRLAKLSPRFERHRPRLHRAHASTVMAVRYVNIELQHVGTIEHPLR